MPKSKPPRTNIDKELEKILHTKIDHQLDDWSEAVPALKYLFLKWVEELCGEADDPYPNLKKITLASGIVGDREVYAIARNQLRREILEKGKERLM